MQTILIYIIAYQLAALHGDQKFQREMYAQIGSEVILTCKISKEASTPRWRKHNIILTRGFEINRRFRGHERLDITTDQRFYNLKICNITEHDFGTYWCETQQGNSITTEGTQLIHSGMYVGKSLLNGLFATGFAVLCLSVCGNCFFNKCRAAIARRKGRSSDDNENKNVLQGNATNNVTANDTALGENENVFSHYETINENGMIEKSIPTTSHNLSSFADASYMVQYLQPDNACLEVIEDTNNLKLDPRTKTNGDEDHVSIFRGSQREIIEINNFEDCKTSNNSISVSS